MVDAHCHLGDAAFAQARDAVLARARAAGVGHVVVIGATLDEAARAMDLARRTPGLSATAGVHPHEAKSWSPDAARRLPDLLADPTVAAVGETGPHRHHAHRPGAAHRRACEAQSGRPARRGRP